MQNRKKPRTLSAGRYVEAFSWHEDIDTFLRTIVKESPLLHVCAGASNFGDVRVDRYVAVPGEIIADWLALPFANDSFGAVFADPPWLAAYMKPCSDFCKEALRVAPVAYVMSPWLWVKKDVTRKTWIREFPGICTPINITRYARG